ncbi:hypothetical protein KY362_05310 [Candidatus Woesearchaeota archaeon]|nr:hypothetical protein [Candidatus Woesearchaeota archaeon]
MFRQITEAHTTIFAPEEEHISKDLPVFYNPVMKFNRDVSILILKAVENKDLQICDPLAGTGIRSIRFLMELPKEKIKSITINDNDPKSCELIQRNLRDSILAMQDKHDKAGVELITANTEASLLLLQSSGYDYIDIDPFGTPNPFLDAACKRIARNGILAVTATDTSALAGAFPKSCRRKYWAEPDQGPLKHEVGLRILIRKVQLIASQYERALTPIFSYSKEHYMRVFFRCEKGKSKVDEIIKQHAAMESDDHEVGPMWTGTLWDPALCETLVSLAEGLDYETDIKFLTTIAEESKIDTIGFHDIHHLCKMNRIEVPKFGPIFENINKKGHTASRTHFSEYGIRSDIEEKDIVKIIKNIVKKKRA